MNESSKLAFTAKAIFLFPRVENIWILKLAFRAKEDYSRQSRLRRKN